MLVPYITFIIEKNNHCFTIKTLKSIIFSMEVNSDNHVFI